MTNLRSYYLEELLKPYGEVQALSRVAGEVREIEGRGTNHGALTLVGWERAITHFSSER